MSSRSCFSAVGYGLAVTAGMLLLSGCVPTSLVKPVVGLSDVTAGQTILVGRVELDPPLAPDEQKLSESYKEFENAALMILDEQPRSTQQLVRSDFSRRIDAPFDKTFFVQSARQPGITSI